MSLSLAQPVSWELDWEGGAEEGGSPQFYNPCVQSILNFTIPPSVVKP